LTCYASRLAAETEQELHARAIWRRISSRNQAEAAIPARFLPPICWHSMSASFAIFLSNFPILSDITDSVWDSLSFYHQKFVAHSKSVFRKLDYLRTISRCASFYGSLQRSMLGLKSHFCDFSPLCTRTYLDRTLTVSLIAKHLYEMPFAIGRLLLFQ